MFQDLTLLRAIAIVVDVLLVAFVIYKLIMVIRGTRAVQLVKGITVILAVWFLSGYFGLNTLQWIMQQAVTYGLLAIIIIFQPELRRALEHLGRGRFFQSTTTAVEEEIKAAIEHIIKSVNYMGKRRIGALISIERETGMSDYVETGVSMNARLTTELMTNIFIPNAPLHDGAVIVNVRGNEILAAGCYLPLSENPFISKELGTRHRAALGVSEVTDAITLAVSEETGGISITKNGELHRNLDEDSIREMLEQELLKKDGKNSSSRWKWGGKKNG
ncbi:diadenylate cyclase CdaA [Salisediminibacterium halotolerans]|uniref:Diadenylate cyclase n=1 Tax=Salisediminibacterium halotolerans TaxID=517425 RepID=A0A1H9WUU3_9BACI|nr:MULTISPECIES: diadenylate cyclase CdaA [Salisediminibacterium]RLJ73183.1 diadenylate cyclase [Actinophytocola xinjiangensis]RPE86605.1 diadenylate cyclase [Salisediminibacterium halotolerans]TWG33980.1 diadenylate cyclase [Salisediminibacterium halotolerans]SES37698.1 diadenylate cyclase [Salisediminibacterium haloalkalitolerans]GEL06613.1 cyclic di-AMP synthase CdaA [Salisediminibacterium halotolerans]